MLTSYNSLTHFGNVFVMMRKETISVVWKRAACIKFHRRTKKRTRKEL